jgi:integrase
LFAAEDTKSGRPDERPLPDQLTPCIDRWLGHWRGFFTNPGDAFWTSIKGGGLAYTLVGSIISAVTRREIGVDVSPHLFRHSAVYTVALRQGNQMGIASGVLQHTDPRTTAIYDIKGRSVQAGRALYALVSDVDVRRQII